MEKEDFGDTGNLLGFVGKLFLPTVLHFWQQNMYPAKVCLHLDKSSGHPAILSAFRTPLDVSVVYRPSNGTSLFQPMDQEVIATFKAYYLYQTFMQMVRVLDRSDKSITALI
jgi:hypothetical protein